ncbi:MAG: metallophosphoesterase [Calditrichia bacterium]
MQILAFSSTLRFNFNKRTPVIALLILILFVSCSHKTPYYKQDNLSTAASTINPDEITTRIILFGDGGEPQPDEPVLQSLRNWASQIPEKTTVFFLGDNIYPTGMVAKTDPWRPEAERRLIAQLDVIKNSGAKAVFIPGNHDWAKGKPQGLSNLREQQQFVTQYLNDNESFLPQNGCPGPSVRDFDAVRVIVLDTHWWFQKHEKPSSECPQGDKKEILSELQRLISETPAGKKVIVLAHHPLKTHGPHGGFFTWKDHIFPLTNLASWMWLPLPIIGSLYPLGRWNIVKSNQDLNGPLYKDMVSRLDSIFSQKPPLIYASGHDHNLQVLDGDSTAGFILVSGAGVQEKLNDVGDGDDTIFAHSHTGFMSVDFLSDGRVSLRVIEPENEIIVFSKWLN